MESHAQISTEVLCRYAADAAREVAGVRGLVEGQLPVRHRGVRVASTDGKTRVELRLAVEWGVSIPDVGRAVQTGVRDYLVRMADLDVESVDIVVDEIARPNGQHP